MKLSAKLVTALAAIALVVVALSGVVKTAQAANVDGTVSLNKAWYNSSATVTITVNDADKDTSAATSSTFTFDNDGSFQNATLKANLADKSGDGTVDSSDFTVVNTDGSTDVNVDSVIAVSVNDVAAGFVTIALRPGKTSSDALLTGGSTGNTALKISYEVDTLQTLVGKVKVTSTQDATGFLVDVSETSASSGGKFTTTITLTTGSSSSTTKTLKVTDGDTVTATFTDDTPAAGTSRVVTDQAKVETTGATIDVVSPANKFSTQERRPKFTATISDNESGVDKDTIRFNVGGTDFVADDTTSAGGVITATFRPGTDLLSTSGTQFTTVTWFVKATDIAGNTNESDSDSTTTGNQTHTLTIDRIAPNLSSADTGTIWDTSKTTTDKTNAAKDDVNSLVAVFDEDLDAATVSEADFTVDGITPTSAQVFSGAKKSVFITLAGAFKPADKPVVKVVGAIGDIAGNTSSVDTTTATDGIAPTFTASLSKSLTLDKVDLTITSDEPIQGNVPVIKVHTPDSTTTTVARTITGIKVTGTNAWSVTIDEAASADNLFDGVQAVEITGNDAAGNSGKLGGSDVKATGAITFTVDTTVAAPTFTPANSTTVTNDAPFVQVKYAEAVTLTAATFQDGTGTAVDVLATLIASSADNKLFVLSPGNYPGGASTLSLATHTLKVSATDAAGNKSTDKSATFTVTARKDFSLPLIAGWNLVSLPGMPSDPSINAVITSSDVGTVITYDPTVAGKFVTAVRDSVTGKLTGALTQIDAQHGYWINTTSFDPITVAIPAIPPATLPPTIPVFEGWNLVPVVDTVGTATAGTGLTGVSTYFAGLGTTLSKVYSYDGLTGAFTAISGSTTVEVGEGLWVFVTADGTITP